MKYTKLALLALSLSYSAYAAEFNHSGVLYDTNTDTTIDDKLPVVFSIYNGDDNLLWTNEKVVEFVNGNYSVTLGENIPIDDSFFTNSNLSLGININNDGEMSPRLKIYTTPRSYYAEVAGSLEGDANLTELKINGNTIIDQDGNWLGKLAGIQGETGDKGDTGPAGSGEQGIQGPKGDAGEPGIQGPKGDAGAQGVQGSKGDTGARGAQGPKGDTGPSGSSSGVKGDQGLQGLQGLQGIQGAKGDQGSQGLQGIQGVKGDQGSQGLQGIQGAKGDQGDQGLQGIQGVKGDQGDQGIQGIQGIKGDQGDQGLQGAKGDQGNQGIQGAKGDQGPQGSSSALVNYYNQTEINNINKDTTAEGTLVYNSNKSALQLLIDSNEHSLGTSNSGNITAGDSSKYAQTLSLNNSGTLAAIKLMVGSSTLINITIMETGNSASLETLSSNISVNGGWNTINLATPKSLNSGTEYSLVFDNCNCNYDSNDSYTGGMLIDNPEDGEITAVGSNNFDFTATLVFQESYKTWKTIN